LAEQRQQSLGKARANQSFFFIEKINRSCLARSCGDRHPQEMPGREAQAVTRAT
jgi:hypothetical protein